MRTTDNIYMHELIGLNAVVVKASNQNYIGVTGKIIDETKNTFIFGTNGEQKTIPKKDIHIKIILNEKETVLNGNLLAIRPHDRTKKLWLKRKKWRNSI